MSRPAEPAKKWGDFQLLQRLGEGGFGEVYRAWDPILEREVALKFLRARGMNPEQEYATIISEARAIARVRHENVVSVYGVDRKDGRVGFWSDFVRGQTLADILATQGPVSCKEAAEIGIAVCEALTAVHHAGLLHRDIKASNAMCDETGRILLMDFGLSHNLHSGSGLAGTPHYIAPELLAGSAASVQTDIYAIGVLLHVLCTGAFPNRKHADDAEVQTDAKLSPALQEVVRTATNSDPKLRYLSAAKLREALAATLTDGPAANQPRRKPLLRRGAWIGTAIVLLIAGVVLIPQSRKWKRAAVAGASPVAYQDFLAAEEALQRYDKPGNTQKAIELYKHASKIPEFRLGWGGPGNGRLADVSRYIGRQMGGCGQRGRRECSGHES